MTLSNLHLYTKKSSNLQIHAGLRSCACKFTYCFYAGTWQIRSQKIALLAGLAPLNNDSGKFKGKRTIRGGRENIRSILYMPTMAAIRFNPAIKEFYERLLSKGKPKKWPLQLVCENYLLRLMPCVKQRLNGVSKNN